ncbi:non-specific lipid transfer protein GPI-anchored 5-like [Cryptomeria japonica]|uniref:non-specific lipid transfer protein GPI-anchored 5-like n=1 Tax=Cryptomeria japonica TaxID=3369 RepID=UPI0027DA72CC|nr:non-specific lipid transfer protein GPI-anchored 5-like [Cryptomeria japonica]
MAQSSCTTGLVSLSPCLSYISGNQTTPSQGCCTALATVVKNNPSCLCQLLTGNNQLGIPINQTRALALPGECKVTTPPVSQCQGKNLFRDSTTSPSPTVSEVPPSSPSTNGSGTPTSEATPSSNPTQNNSASNIFASPVLKVVTAVVLAAVVM